jgi:hypothetical protein
MGYPTGPLLKELTARILGNLRFIERATRHYHTLHTKPPYSDTQLLVSLLGVLVFPNERASDALGQIMAEYPGIRKIVQLKYTDAPAGQVFLPNDKGEERAVDPNDLKNLARLLRNSIAHFNIMPINQDGRFGGIRVWNTDERGRVTMVADLMFDKLRPLAQFVLEALAQRDHNPPIQDPEDPLEIVKRQGPREQKRRPPKLTDSIWDRYMTAFGGDYVAAHEHITAVLKKEGDRLNVK